MEIREDIEDVLQSFLAYGFIISLWIVGIATGGAISQYMASWIWPFIGIFGAFLLVLCFVCFALIKDFEDSLEDYATPESDEGQASGLGEGTEGGS